MTPEQREQLMELAWFGTERAADAVAWWLWWLCFPFIWLFAQLGRKRYAEFHDRFQRDAREKSQ